MYGSDSAKGSKTVRDSIRVYQTCLSALAHERAKRHGEGCAKGHRFDSADVGMLESSEDLSGKVVVAARLNRGQPLA